MSMTQLGIWGDHEVQSELINVAQIPQRSPFRYPGGKTWLVPHIRKWLKNLDNKPRSFIEPFLGGGIVSLTVAFEDLAARVTMIELDEDVAALWKTLLNDEDNDWLAQQVAEFDLTVENFRREISTRPSETRRAGFQTLLKNRTFHGGILAPGSGILKYGENGKGIRSRWYAETLRKRIQNIKHFSHKLEFFHGDGIEAINKYAHLKNAAFFVDPPYTAGKKGKRAGTRLYTHFELDHDRLFSVVKKIAGDFLMTYDNADEVKELAEKHGFDWRTISMMNTHHATMKELLIARDLSWIYSPHHK
jgi:DNA adenine methylase